MFSRYLRKGWEEKSKEGTLPYLPPQVPSSRGADVRLDLRIQSCSCPLAGPAAEPEVGPVLQQIPDSSGRRPVVSILDPPERNILRVWPKLSRYWALLLCPSLARAHMP